MASEKEKIGRLRNEFPGLSIAGLSAVSGEGLGELEEKIYNEVTSQSTITGGFAADAITEAALGEMIVTARQKAALVGALTALSAVKTTIKDGLTRDITAGELRIALDRLGEITGETTTEDILDKIFSEFCVGK